MPDEVRVHGWALGDGASGGDPAWLSADERARAERFASAEVARRFVDARAGLRARLARYLGVPPERIEIEVDARGRPRLGGAHRGALDFNLSHSGGCAVLAVSAVGRVGVDVEERARAVDEDAVARRLFGAEALEAWRAMRDVEARRAVFFDRWTLHEAWSKWTGEGLRRDPRGVWFEGVPALDGVVTDEARDALGGDAPRADAPGPHPPRRDASQVVAVELGPPEASTTVRASALVRLDVAADATAARLPGAWSRCAGARLTAAGGRWTGWLVTSAALALAVLGGCRPAGDDAPDVAARAAEALRTEVASLEGASTSDGRLRACARVVALLDLREREGITPSDDEVDLGARCRRWIPEAVIADEGAAAERARAAGDVRGLAAACAASAHAAWVMEGAGYAAPDRGVCEPTRSEGPARQRTSGHSGD